MVAVDYNIRDSLTVENENWAHWLSASRNMGLAPGANLDALARPKGQRQDVAGQP
jgi:hypothetical protein